MLRAKGDAMGIIVVSVDEEVTTTDDSTIDGLD
jgi:hypothetical protein